MKRIIALILCAGLVLTLFAGCAEENTVYVPTGNALVMDDGSTIATAPQTGTEDKDTTVTLTYYPDRSLNPILCTDLTNRTLFSLLYQGLFSVDRDYNVEPVLCKNYTVSKDMRTYTFYLEYATFSDGSMVTAADVVATLHAAKESAYYGGRFFYFNTISATADGAVMITLNTAYENLPILLDIPILKAEEVAAEQPLGTGPYALQVGRSGLQMRRRTDWWCQAELVVKADYITLLEAESPAGIRDDFQFSGLDLVCTNPGTDSYADYRCDYELWDCESGNFVYLAVNMKSELFSINEVRAALPYAVDRDALASDHYRGFGQSASLPASPDSPYYSQTLAAKYSYDPVKFVTALESAGKKGSTVVLLVNSDDSLRLRVAKDVKAMLEECGLVVTLSALSTSSYKQALQKRKYDLVLGQTKLSANMDLTAFFYTWGNLSSGALDDSTLYALCRDALANSGNYYNLHKTVMNDGRLCPILFFNYAVYATRGLESSLTPARDNVFYYSLGKTMEEALLETE